MGAKKIAWSCLFLVLSLAFIIVPGVMAQTSGSGAITGIVTDPSGGSVPNVTVTITNADTGQARVTMTGTDGSYTVGLLLPGTYKVKFEAAGFKPVEIPGVPVTVTETQALNYHMEVASAAQTVVTVEAEAENVDTTSSTMGTVIASKSVTDMPLSSRQYTDLLGLTAAGNASVLNATGLGKASVDTVVNGASTEQNNYQMDGASINNFGSFQRVGESSLYPAFGVPAPDAVQEFKIQTSTYDASAGRNPGAVVNVVTKSGGNAFHGDAFEFFRNTDLNANDFFLNMKTGAAAQRGVLNQNQYGGTIGGPIKKDKLFFFGSYQETGQKNGLGSTSISTPTLPPLPAGDRGSGLNAAGLAFRSALGAAVCEANNPKTTATAQDYPVAINNDPMILIGCNGANINPVAINILQLKNPDGSYYIPSSGTSGYVTTAISIPSIYKEHQFVANWDYLISAKNTLSGRLFRAESPVTTSFPSSGFVPDSGLTYAPTNYEAVLKLTTVVSNNLVNEARVSFQRNFLNDVPSMPFTTDQIGQTPASPGFGDKIGQFGITGGFSFGVSQFLWETNAVNQYQAADQLSWTHGKHTVRAGYEMERDQWNWQQPSLALGSTTISTFADFLIGLPGCAPGTYLVSCSAAAPGNTNGTQASNLGAISNTAELTTPSGNSHRFRSHDYSAFVQDDFKLFPRLTLNLGLRWEFDGNVSDPGGSNSSMWLSLIGAQNPIPGTTPATGSLVGWVVPNNATEALPAGVTRANQNIISRNHTPLNNFAPRFGFAWQPTSSDHLVLRGGVGYFYDRIAGDPLVHSFIENAPFGVSMGGTTVTNYFASLANPYPTTPIGFVPRFACLSSASDGQLNPNASYCPTGQSNSSNIPQGALAENFLTPLVYEWNLNLQYEFLNKWTLEVGYVGSRGIHQSIAYTGGGGGVPVNVARIVSPSSPAFVADGIVTTNTSTNASLRVPYLGLAPGFPISATNGDYKFNGLQTTLRKAFSYGMTLQSTFAWSRSFMGDYVNSPFAEVYGLNPSYHPLRMSLSYAWTIPNGKLKGFLHTATSGWTVTGVTIIQDGTPLTPTDSRNCTIYGAGSFLSCTPTYAAGMGPANVATTGPVSSRLGVNSEPQGYLNPLAFEKPPASPFAADTSTGLGTAGQGYVLGPGQNNWDMSIGKITKVGGLREDATLLFRAEFFNSFNHPQFSNPSVAANSSAFGQITSMSVNPRILQLALKYQF